MGLGPPVCTKCKILYIYIPNEEDPTRQGRWVCPFNEFHEESSLWAFSMEEQKLYLDNSKFLRFITKDYSRLTKQKSVDN